VTDTLASAGHPVPRVPVGTSCAVHRHRDYVPLNVHHIRPLSLGGLNVPANRVTICMNAHGLVHEAMRRLMDNNGTIPDRGHFGAKVVALAVRGWTEAGSPTHGGGSE
jgi:hypothetical protein